MLEDSNNSHRVPVGGAARNTSVLKLEILAKTIPRNPRDLKKKKADKSDFFVLEYLAGG